MPSRLLSTLIPTLGAHEFYDPANIVRSSALKAVQQNTAQNASRPLKEAKQNTAPAPVNTAPAPVNTAPRPTAQPTAQAPTFSPQQQFEQAIASADPNMDSTQRRAFIEQTALNLNAPELVGSEVAARWMNQSFAPRARVMETVERDAGVATDAPAVEALRESGTTVQERMGALGMPEPLSERMNTLEYPSLPELERGYEEDLNALYERRQALSDQQYQTLLTDLNRRYSEQRTALEEANRQNLGATQMFLGRAGAFSSASGQGAISGEVSAGQARLRSLALDEANALQSAFEAKEAGDIQAMSDLIAQADARRQERNQIALQEYQADVDRYSAEYATMSDAYNDELMRYEATQNFLAQEAELASASVDILKGLTSEQLEQIPESYFTNLENTFRESGMSLPPNYFKSFVESVRNVEQAQTAQAQLDAEIELFKLAKDVPAGFTFTIGDSTVRGLKGGSGKSYSIDDGAGNTSFVTIDEDTGEIMSQFTLPIGKRTVVGSGGSALAGTGSMSGGQYSYLLRGREMLGQPIANLATYLGLEPDDFGGDPTRPVTKADIISAGIASNLLSNESSLDYWETVDATLDTDMYSDVAERPDGSVQITQYPKFTPVTPDSVSQLVVTAEEAKKPGFWDFLNPFKRR